MLKCDLGKTLKTGHVFSREGMLAKKLPAPSLDKIQLSSTMTDFFFFFYTYKE